MQLNRPLAFLLVVQLGCRPGPASIPQVDAFTLTGPTVPTVPPEPTEPTDPTPPDPPEPFVPPLLPSATILGLPGLHLDMTVAVVPGSNGDPAVLMLSGYNTEPEFVAMGVPPMYVVDGRVPLGDHGILELWDGVSSYTYYGASMETTHLAGDVNGDGHTDVWIGDELQLGPLLGKVTEFRNGQAWVYGDGGVVAAGSTRTETASTTRCSPRAVRSRSSSTARSRA